MPFSQSRDIYHAGSAYSYSYATLGEYVAWFVGWNLVLEYLFAAATVAAGLISVVIIAALTSLGTKLNSKFTAVSNALN